MRVVVEESPEIDLRLCTQLEALTLRGLRLTRVPMLASHICLKLLDLDHNLIELSTEQDILMVEPHDRVSFNVNAIAKLRPLLCLMTNRKTGHFELEDNPVVSRIVRRSAPKSYPIDEDGAMPVERISYVPDELTFSRVRCLEAVLYAGLAPNVIKGKGQLSQHWYDFLCRGLYDPRLFVTIWHFTSVFSFGEIDVDEAPIRDIMYQQKNQV